MALGADHDRHGAVRTVTLDRDRDFNTVFRGCDQIGIVEKVKNPTSTPRRIRKWFSSG
jgi:hypothetical protein